MAGPAVPKPVDHANDPSLSVVPHRSRARDLAEQAERKFDEARRTHLFDMADAFERAADELIPANRNADEAATQLIAHLRAQTR